MLRIRLSRTGRKNLNLFRVVVAEHKAPVKGRFVEILGNFNPNSKLANFKVNEKRLRYWLSVGAQPTDTVTNLLVDAKLLPEKEKIKKTTKKKARKKEEKAEKPDVIESPAAQKGEGSAMEIADVVPSESEEEEESKEETEQPKKESQEKENSEEEKKKA
jgi:small subunit ribosomal protein S16